jgi:hypothetical protein
MGIYIQIVWLGGLLIEGVILVRSVLGRSLAKYPYFYLYIASVFTGSTARYVLAIVRPSLEHGLYWPKQYVTLFLGCGVIFEVSRHVFAQRVTLDRIARWTMLVTFGAIFLSVAVQAFFLPHWNVTTNTADLERDLRVAQAIVLMTILFLTGYYGISIGKNIKGMILGFGIYIGASVFSLTLRLFVGTRFDPAFGVIQSTAYLAALAVWMVALWSYESEPVEKLPSISGGEYQSLAGRTQEILGSINEHLDRTVPR